jgi:Domain of unknown function (DUF4386)
MNATVLQGWSAEASPRTTGRLAALFFLLTIVLGVLAQSFVSERLVIPSDAAATAANLASHEALYRFGFAVYLVEMACQITMVALFYDLLRPASTRLSRLAAIFGLVGCTIKALSRLFYIAPLLLLGDAEYLRVFSGEQLQALALVLHKVNDGGAAIALVFFGIYALLKGYLMLRSTFLPRALGVLSLMGGAGWLTFLSPPLGMQVFPIVALVALTGSVATIGWLLVVGVDDERWRAQELRLAAPRRVP